MKMISPSPVEVKQARAAAGLTQTEASQLVHAGLRSWMQWEAGDRAMHPAFWELFLLKARKVVKQNEGKNG